MKRYKLIALAAAAAAALFVAGCLPASAEEGAQKPTTTGATRSAVFAGGCFWCMEKPFDELDGVLATTSGYAGGRDANPSYEQVSSGSTGHAEVVRIDYDPKRVSYEKLLEVFWRNVDPFDGGGQFCDCGSQYRSAIFVSSDAERQAAAASKTALEKRFGRDIATGIVDASPFYAAEDYHQDYYKKNPIRYRYYRGGCGRDGRLKAVWGKEAGG